MDASTQEPIFYNDALMFANLNGNRFDPVLYEVVTQLDLMGIEVETLQTEYGDGQFELVLKPQIGIKIADNVFVAKDCIKEVARKYSMNAIFIAKISNASDCNAMHFNHSLRAMRQDDIGNIFSDVSKKDRISSVCRSWIGGLVCHYRALAAVCNPTVNCYRRLNTHWNPRVSDWGVDDRTASYRIKNSSPEATYIESRLPSSSANPYLVLASTVAAGVNGIKQDFPCPPPSTVFPSSPTPPTTAPSTSSPSAPTTTVPNLTAVTNPTATTLATRSATASDLLYSPMEPHKVPHNLVEGLEALQDDAYLVDALGKDFVKWFVLLKRGELNILVGRDAAEKNSVMLANECELYAKLM